MPRPCSRNWRTSSHAVAQVPVPDGADPGSRGGVAAEGQASGTPARRRRRLGARCRRGASGAADLTPAMTAPPTPAMTALPTSTTTAPPAAATTALPAAAAAARPATAAGARAAANAPASTAADSDAPTSAPGRRPGPAPRPLAAVLSAPASAPSSDRARLAPAPGTLRITDTPPPGRPNGGGARNGRAPVTVLRTSARKQAEKRRAAAERSLFVVDTNVLMHDPTALFRFQEHDVYLPMMTLEELDTTRTGCPRSRVMRARSPRRSMRWSPRPTTRSNRACPLAAGQQRCHRPALCPDQALSGDLPAALPIGKADNQILSVVSALSERESERKVVLVSKDINMRIKARALGLAAEDYFSDQVTRRHGPDVFGVVATAGGLLGHARQGDGVLAAAGLHLLPDHRAAGADVLAEPVRLARWRPATARPGARNQRQTAVLQTLRDYAHNKNTSGESRPATANRTSR